MILEIVYFVLFTFQNKIDITFYFILIKCRIIALGFRKLLEMNERFDDEEDEVGKIKFDVPSPHEH